MAITWNPQKFTEGAVIAGCLIFWFAWQIVTFVVAVIGQDGCTKSGCGGPDYVVGVAKEHAVMTAVSLFLLSPLILRAAGRVVRYGLRYWTSAVALALGVGALAVTWLVTIDLAYGCCSYWTDFLPAWLSVPLFGIAPVLGTVAAVALASTYATPRIDHNREPQQPAS
jgi:hypothetical protein